MLIPKGRPRFNRWGAGWALQIVVVYAILGTLWIVGSDWAAEQLFGEVATRAAVQTTKGLAYVLGTAVVFGLLLRRAARRLGRAEEMISDAAWFERAVFEHLPGFVYRCRNDPDWTMEFVSDGCRALTGYTPRDLIDSRQRAYADLIHPDDRATVRRAVQAAVDTDEPFQVTYRIRTREGEERWVWEQGRAERQGGTVEALHGVIIDITEWKRLESQLQQMQRLEAIGQLTGGIAHDFNNLLSVILASTDLLDEDLAAADVDDDVRATVRETRAAAASAASLIAKLAGFARHAQTQFRPLDLGEALTDIAKMIRRVVPESIDLELAPIPPDLPAARADRHSVEQILLNLATNSRDAMPTGGRLRLSVDLAELDESDRVRRPWLVPGTYVCVTVADEGTGMNADTLERIFDPFFTTKPSGRGTGLGMSMVYGLMKQHRGHVHVYSEPTHGTRVRLYFPLAGDDDGKDRRQIPPSLDTLPRGDGETILLVEDNEQLRDTGRRVLERLGYRVLTAEDGEAALAIVTEKGDQIDLVLSDLVMPRLGGLELRARLRERGWAGGFLLASGYSADEARRQLAESPEILFLRKPWTLRQVAEAVRAALEQHPA